MIGTGSASGPAPFPLSPELNDKAELEEPMARKAKVKVVRLRKWQAKQIDGNTRLSQYLARQKSWHLTRCSTGLGNRVGNWYQRYPKTTLHFLYSNARAASSLFHHTLGGLRSIMSPARSFGK